MSPDGLVTKADGECKYKYTIPPTFPLVKAKLLFFFYILKLISCNSYTFFHRVEEGVCSFYMITDDQLMLMFRLVN